MEAGVGGIRNGSVVIAAITSCTNTSNPRGMLAAGLLAKRAVEFGLKVPGWVKTSLAEDIQKLIRTTVAPELFIQSYSGLYAGDEMWKKLNAPRGEVYAWQAESNYIQEAPFFIDLPQELPEPGPLCEARTLLLLGDSVTTDHISPAGKIGVDSPAGRYLQSQGVPESEFNTYGSRRGNHEVMVRGTFANVRLRNFMLEQQGGYTLIMPLQREIETVWEAAEEYRRRGTPLIVCAGKEYGSGSSRDWAAKGTSLLGIKAVIAESFERIHRSNLIGMGVLPLQFQQNDSWRSLGLTGQEVITIEGIHKDLRPGQLLKVTAVLFASNPESIEERERQKRREGQKGRERQKRREDRKGQIGLAVSGKAGGPQKTGKYKERSSELIEFEVLCRLDSEIEVEYWRHGGVLNYVVRSYASNS